MEKEDILVIDLDSLPIGWDVGEWINLVKTKGIAVVDSRNNKRGQFVKPYLLHPRRRLNLKIVSERDYNLTKQINGNKERD